ncbi:kinase-like domain-containing protein, partial [Mycena vulgaris]
PGGLCPVKLGDIIGPDGSTAPPRYRISAKLGYGAFATVWLAHDAVKRRIVEASQTQETHERAILERLRAPSGSAPPGVLQLRDSFRLRSVNGVHDVLVTETVILLHHLLKLPGLKTSMRSLVRQVVEGLAFIHARGVAHGDLSPNNLGVAIPELETFSSVDIWESWGLPAITPLVAFDGARDPASFPPYLSYSMDLKRFLLARAPGFITREPRVCILDLGRYFTEDSPSPRCNAPISFAPPEVVFPRLAHSATNDSWDHRADIWSLATTIYQIAGRHSLLLGHGLGLPLLDEMAALCGGAPEEWTQYFDTVPGRHLRRVLADDLWTKRAECFIDQGTSKEDAEGLVKLLRRMLVIDPAGRPSALELLEDPYLTRIDVEISCGYSPVLNGVPLSLPHSISVV